MSEPDPTRPAVTVFGEGPAQQASVSDRRAAAEERRRRRQLRAEREHLPAAQSEGRSNFAQIASPSMDMVSALGQSDASFASTRPSIEDKEVERLRSVDSEKRKSRAGQTQIQVLLRTALESKGPIENVLPQSHLGFEPSSPSTVSRGSGKRGTVWSFAICVVIPVVCAAWYYWAIASDQYVSEFRFAVTTAPSPSGSSTSTDASTMSMSSLFNGMGLGGSASAQNYIVADYIVSRQAIYDLKHSGIDPAKIYGRDDIDFLSRLRDAKNDERLADYWQRMVSATYDPISGLASAEVRAFSPQDAYSLANGLVSQSEQLVNRIASRAKVDAVQYAEQEVERSNRELSEVRTKLDSFRQANGTIEPNTGIVTSNVQVAATLRATLAGLETDYITLLSQKVADNSPSVLTVKARIAATKQQIAHVEQEVSTNVSDKSALAKVIADYERIDLDRQHSQAAVLAAMQLLDSARASAASQSFYLTPYVLPAMPHSARYPQRWLALLAAGLVAFGIWMIGVLVVRSLRAK